MTMVNRRVVCFLTFCAVVFLSLTTAVASESSWVPDRGFRVDDQRQLYTMYLGFYGQLRADAVDLDDDDGIATNDTDADASFYLNRIELKLSGEFWNEQFSYCFNGGYAESAGVGSFALLDAHLDYKVGGESLVQFRIGQFKTPFLKEAIMSNRRLFFIDNSMLYYKTRALNERDVGLMIHGIYGLISSNQSVGYAFGVFDGRGMNATFPGAKGGFDPASAFSGKSIAERELLFAGRAFLYIGQSEARMITHEGFPTRGLQKQNIGLELEFGVCAATVRGTEGDTSNLRAPDVSVDPLAPEQPFNRAMSIDVTARLFDRVEAQMEYIVKATLCDGDATVRNASYDGLKVQATYDISQAVGAVGVSAALFNPDSRIDHNSIREFRIGWLKYIGGLGHANKVSVNYSETQTEKTATQTEIERKVSVQWQANF